MQNFSIENRIFQNPKKISVFKGMNNERKDKRRYSNFEYYKNRKKLRNERAKKLCFINLEALSNMTTIYSID
jgi:hypothetical protein